MFLNVHLEKQNLFHFLTTQHDLRPVIIRTLYSLDDLRNKASPGRKDFDEQKV